MAYASVTKFCLIKTQELYEALWTESLVDVLSTQSDFKDQHIYAIASNKQYLSPRDDKTDKNVVFFQFYPHIFL